MIKVGINGFGTIGKRIATAIEKQDDMELVGIAKRRVDYAIKQYADKLDIYGDTKEYAQKMSKDLHIAGELKDLLKKVDVIIDATPSGIGAENKKIYNNYNIKVIFQGGEKHEVSNFSFNAFVNYSNAKGKNAIRVVSCNTTGLIRTLYPLHKDIGIDSVKAVLVRRATDPLDHKKGPINAIVPDFHFPSHHGPDVSTVVPGFEINTFALKVPTTLMHVHVVFVTLKKETTKEEVISIFSNAPRIMLLEKKYGIESTAQVMELAKELGRDRSDLYENAVWLDGIHVAGKELYFYQAVHQESIVVPENIDAIRAIFGTVDQRTSIKKTNLTLGIMDSFV